VETGGARLPLRGVSKIIFRLLPLVAVEARRRSLAILLAGHGSPTMLFAVEDSDVAFYIDHLTPEIEAAYLPPGARWELDALTATALVLPRWAFEIAGTEDPCYIDVPFSSAGHVVLMPPELALEGPEAVDPEQVVIVPLHPAQSTGPFLVPEGFRGRLAP
jgi:hypothetical protein